MTNRDILTEKYFWENELSGLDLPILLKDNIRADRAFISLFNSYFSKKNETKKTVLEVGCNPGKFLIYFKKYLNYNISGFDYDEVGCEITKENIKIAGVSGFIKQTDILNFEPKEKFDVVLSCGFIEHFVGDALEKVMDVHIKLLKKNGKLFISIPNFRYVNYTIAYLLRRNTLNLHNLEVMQKSFFKSFAKKHSLKIEFLDYFGGIHIGGIKLNNNTKINKIINKKIIHKYEKLRGLDNINSKYFSHHLGAVFTKK
jgi:2-polyprenyl-3-methyl-5-hydroxy-6-metoxy-1,4-benzoquinol methylase